MTATTSPTLAFLAFSAGVHADTSTSLTRACEHLAEARRELDRLILEDHSDSLDLRIYHGAQLLDDAAVVLGGGP